ncbi:hypothetical protein BJ741DRAFT_593881 [Chytriomyces cf. hyalinus JEL632]|nr:hypothetical protein BJ741DRAFT_593881 [Chytriomyces cf. hyalinus JEL632]
MMQHPLFKDCDSDSDMSLDHQQRSSPPAVELAKPSVWRGNAAAAAATAMTTSRRDSVSSVCSFATTTSAGTTHSCGVQQQQQQQSRRRHIVSKGDTLEGICIAYGCLMSDLKKLNGLYWQSDSIHLRKHLLIPDKINAPAAVNEYGNLKHELSAHPNNLKLFGGRRASSILDVGFGAGDDTSDCKNNATKDSKRYRKASASAAATTTTTQEPLLQALRALDADVESIIACFVKPAPDTPVSGTPVIQAARATMNVCIYHVWGGNSVAENVGDSTTPPPPPPYQVAGMGETSGSALKRYLRRRSDAPLDSFSNRPIRENHQDGRTTRQPVVVKQRTVSDSVAFNSCSLMRRGDWKVVVEIEAEIGRVLGDGVRKVVETDVAGKILRLLV